jgi:hypothetical protein
MLKIVSLSLMLFSSIISSNDTFIERRRSAEIQILNLFNNFRLDFDLPKIEYDYQYSRELQNYNSYNFINVLNCNKTEKIKMKNITSSRQILNWNYLFDYKKIADIKKSVDYYDPWSCSKKIFSGYKTCYDNNKCNYMYPRIIIRSLTHISSYKENNKVYIYGRFKHPLYDNPY